MNIQEELKALVDGELTPEQEAEVRRQVDSDPSLAQQAAFYRLLGEEIRGLASVPEVVGAEGVLARARRRRWLSVLAPLGAVTAFALVSVVFFPVFAQSKASAKSLTRDLAAFRSLGSAGDASASPATVTLGSAKEMAASPGDSSTSTQWYTKKDADLPLSNGAVTKNTYGGAGVRQVPAALAPKVDDDLRGDAPTHVYNAPAGRPAQMPGPLNGNRMVVQNGQVDIAVDDVSRAQTITMGYTRSVGGYEASSSLDKGANGESASAQLSLRVPVSHFEAAMAFLKSIAEKAEDVKSVHVTGQDVTAQYADTNARIKVMRAEEEDYVAMLRAARHLSDIMTIRDRLTDIRGQIEGLQSQAAALKQTSDMSTIDATFETKSRVQPKPVDPPQKTWTGEAWGGAYDGLKSAGQTLGTLAIFLVVYSPLWIPAAFLAWYFARRIS